MVDFTKTGSEIWDDYVTSGLPSSGAKPVDKSDMRDWMGVVEDAFAALPEPADIVETDEIAALVSAYNQANATSVRSDLRVMLMVVSALTYAPPGSPSSGDMYIVPTGATGSWSAQVGKIAFYTAGAWTYLTPADGWSAFAKDSDLLYIYDTSAWVQASSSVVSVTSSLVQVSLLGKPTGGGGGKVKTWLTANNDVFAAGDNTNNQNGYTAAATDLPVKVQFNITPSTITKIVQGPTSTYMLDSTGKVWSFGGNAAGQLGHGDTTSRQVATRIEYFVSNSLAVADIFVAGDASGSNDYVFFLTTGGTAYACGSNATGQLGLGDTTQRTTPTLVTAVSGIARLVCSGNSNAHSLAITTAGALWTTGYNGAGQLGQGDTTQRTTFTVVSGFTNASKGAASGSSTTAVGNSFVLKTDGTVWATGYNAQGQLGQSDTTTRNSFVQVSTLSSITDIQASPDYICTVAAIKSDGNVYVWGSNGAGQCGTANTTNQTAPQAPTFTGQGTVAQIAVAAHSTNGAVYCRTSTGALWAAGLSSNGNLGVNSASSAVSSFTQCVGLDGTVSDFCVTGAAGNFGPAVLYSDGRTATAGDNSKGQLGLGTGTSNSAIFHQVSALTPRGVKGDDGEAGQDGATAGVGFNFSTTTTDSDPGSGIIRLNNASPASATAAYIDNNNRSGSDASAWLDTFDDSGTSGGRGLLQLFDPSAPDTTYRIYLVTGSVVDGAGYRKLSLTHVVGAGTFTNGQHVRASFVPAGANGAAGPTLAVGFNFSTTTTDSDPGSGNLRLNNATPESATAAYFDNNNRGGVDVSAWLDTFDDSGNSSLRGTMLVTDPANSSTNFRIYSVSGSVVDGTGYRKVTIAHVSGGGSFTNGAEVAVWFVPRGATGSGDLASANNLSDLANAATARTNLGLAIGVNVQAYDAELAALAGLTSAANSVPRFTGSGTADLLTFDTDGTLAGNSDTALASQKAVKTYVDGIIAAQDAMVFKGVLDCSANPNYPAANRGDTYRVSVAGKIGGASGTNVEVGDIIICLTDATSAGNQATVGSSWGIIQVNIDGALTTASIGSTVQAYSAILAALAGVTGAADKLAYFTGASTMTTADLTSFARTLLDDATASTARSTLGVAIGTDVQAYDAQLSSTIPQNSKSADYTLVATDSGKHIFHPSADTTGRTFTIPANSSVAFAIGTAITFINQNSAGTITIAITTDTMRLAGAGTTGSRTLAANGVATAIKVTSTEWIISGTGLT